MRELRIVFMGTPEFAVNVLDGIIKEGYKVVGVITAPDKPAGRGRKLQESAVKKYAVEAGLKLLQPTNLKSPDFLKELEEINPNVQVVVAFRMLPKAVWNLPEFGTFNLHASLLPQYRGAAPINWAIMNGETATGVTTFFLDEKIDTGEVILQLGVPIEENDTAGSLHDKLMTTGTKLVLATLDQIKENTVKPLAQEEFALLNEAPKLTKENTRINWELPRKTIYNFIRGLDPYPGAWSELEEDGKRSPVKIYSTAILDEDSSLPAGTLLVDNKKLKVASKDGMLEILEIQIPGKKKMRSRDLLNGYKFKAGAKLL
ncbi:methionyl-tRNA formyltransferase [Antarcticibacterium flavum]|uniref:Methionyl-tRNA formyltransferase n=1 Tax=Antarcticibacterium flavum TaxID=2058175 RepID=A0A5B7X9I9_9FLAO|nr:MULTISPECIES: methionyl-tRNA formyltransferase [Antarcticibacterium]MCM4160351.1 methionyl-tRNA formyltransferase [Antarcticibacterium sp. W02-3]QCY71271.1 methionyl-tRNA formyltransferase [Antarcticibacterium flavum]